jgi:hypothetical protein
MNRLFTQVIALLLCLGVCQAADDLAGLFARPPAESRILKIIHEWPDAPAAQDEVIARLQRQGFGGVVCNVGFKDYLESEPKWQAFVRAVNQAKKAGMALWLYDERGYPSANAGGLVLRDHPEWEARGLLIADAECEGGTVTLDAPPGTPFLCAAFPLRQGAIELRERVNLADQLRAGKLAWQAPAGRWLVLVITEGPLYEGTHAELNLARKMPYPNLLLAEPTARFLDLTHQRYAAHLGGDLGKFFVATFTDEPSLMSLFLRPMPYRVLPWGPRLPAEFQKRRGYPLDPAMVPALIADAGADGRRYRYAFWQTVGELVSENFFGQIQQWCRSHQVPSGGHLLMEEGLVAHVPLYGDFFRCARRLDAPGIDCLTSLPAQVPWFIARLLSSAAELEGKTVVMSETSDHSQRYRPAGDKRPPQAVSEAEIRGTCNRQIVSGVNVITSYYSFADLREEQLRRLNEWIGRCCLMLQGGLQAAQIAVLYPIESVWTRFRPARHWANDAPAAAQVENAYRTAADVLDGAQRDFTFVDARALSEANVEPGALVHRQSRWRVVVLPGADTLPLAAWENLGRFVRAGGVLIALGALPANSDTDLPSARVQALSDEWFGNAKIDIAFHTNQAGGLGIYLPAGAEGLLPAVLDGLLERDVAVSAPHSPIRATHRRIAGREVYFVINHSNKPWRGQVGFAAQGQGEQWDPGAGKRVAADLAARVDLELEPYGARLFRFPESAGLRRLNAGDGWQPSLACRALPASEPILARGEFVRGEIKPDAALSQPARPVWQASAVLTKGKVDTFLFVRLPYPKPLDLGPSDCLVLDTWVPERQQTPNQLLVILHEKDGGDFLATTGRSLGKGGYERSVLPLNRFQLAGWSKDADSELDLTKIDEVRVGWGGYLGAADERVQFSLGLPQGGAVRARGQY